MCTISPFTGPDKFACIGYLSHLYVVITLSENVTDHDSDNDNNVFHSNIQKCSHYKTPSLMSLATFIYQSWYRSRSRSV